MIFNQQLSCLWDKNMFNKYATFYLPDTLNLRLDESFNVKLKDEESWLQSVLKQVCPQKDLVYQNKICSGVIVKTEMTGRRVGSSHLANLMWDKNTDKHLWSSTFRSEDYKTLSLYISKEQFIEVRFICHIMSRA